MIKTPFVRRSATKADQAIQYHLGVRDYYLGLAQPIGERLTKAIEVGADQSENKWHGEYLKLLEDYEKLKTQAEQSLETAKSWGYVEEK